MKLLSGSSHPALAKAVGEALGVPLCPISTERFPDGEWSIDIAEDLSGHTVVMVQSLCAPVGEHLLELALLSDVCRRKGAARLVAVVPYLGYARQDRRETGREPLGARVMAQLLAQCRLDRLVCVDLHSRAVEGCFEEPVDTVSAVPRLAEALKNSSGPMVVVAPDMGAVKRAERFASLLDVPVAVVHKQRLTGATVAARGVVGDVSGRHAIVVDDIISTGGTVEAAVRAVLAAGAAPKVTVAASHALLVGPAIERLRGLPIERLVVSDTVKPVATGLPTTVVSVAKDLAAAVAVEAKRAVT